MEVVGLKGGNYMLPYVHALEVLIEIWGEFR